MITHIIVYFIASITMALLIETVRDILKLEKIQFFKLLILTFVYSFFAVLVVLGIVQITNNS